MASEVVMPRLGWTMDVGRVVEWLKRDGEPVAAGEFLFLVETEKAVTEVEALDSGVLRIPPDAPAVGEDVDVGARLAWIVPLGEAVPFVDQGPAPALVGGVAAAAIAVAVLSPSAAGSAPGAMAARIGPLARPERPAISPRARRAAAALGVEWTLLAGSGSGGRIVERDVLGVVRERPVPG